MSRRGTSSNAPNPALATRRTFFHLGDRNLSRIGGDELLAENPTKIDVNLSEIIWTRGLGVGLPGNFLIREFAGILLLLGYFVALPVWLAKTYWNKYYTQMGLIPYVIGSHLMLWMLMVPIKMYFRWTLNLKYFVSIPEFFFNI